VLTLYAYGEEAGHVKKRRLAAIADGDLVEPSLAERSSSVLAHWGRRTTHRHRQGEVNWLVLADPDDNEFCVLPPMAKPNDREESIRVVL